MSSKLSTTETDLGYDGDVVSILPKSRTETEEALEAVAKRAYDAANGIWDVRPRLAAADFSAGPRVTESSVDATLSPADQKNDRFPSPRPSLGWRVSRALVRFVIAAFIGVAATLAWQSYGEAAKQMIVIWAPQLGGWLLLSATPPLPGTEIAAEQSPSPLAVPGSAPNSPQAALIDQAALDTIAPAAPAAPSLDRQQIEIMSHDLAAVRQSVEQLAAGQEQMARDLATMQAVVQDMSRKVAAPQPRPAAPAARKPVPMLPPPQGARPNSASPPPLH